MNLENGKKNPEAPTLYTLTAEDFSKPSASVLGYKTGDRITRDNFTNFLIFSFALSRGDLLLQHKYFEFLEKKEGFDYKKTLLTFVTKGNWDVFSQEEKDIFKEAFSKVKKHSLLSDFKSETGIKSELEGIISNDNRELNFTEINKFFDFNEIKSMEDFKRSADIFLEHKRNKKRSR